MPECLLKYQWVKLPRTHLPVGKGIMGYWAKLASRAAFRKGRAKYCGYTNDVMPGMWSGGVVGLKSILGVKSRTEALEIMNALSWFGYIRSPAAALPNHSLDAGMLPVQRSRGAGSPTEGPGY